MDEPAMPVVLESLVHEPMPRRHTVRRDGIEVAPSEVCESTGGARLQAGRPAFEGCSVFLSSDRAPQGSGERAGLARRSHRAMACNDAFDKRRAGSGQTGDEHWFDAVEARP